MDGPGRSRLPVVLFASGLVLLLIYVVWAPRREFRERTADDAAALARVDGQQRTASDPPEPSSADAGGGSETLPRDYLSRFGLTGEPQHLELAWDKGLPFGNYAAWRIRAEPLPMEGVTFWQVIRLSQEEVRTPWQLIYEALERRPGSYWVIGNEPDVVTQDNVKPERYAELYHLLYHVIKAKDPLAKIVIGGVSQSTPLRRAYLDIVLNYYEERYGKRMPVDVWNVHAFILPERRDGWGIGIPPGMDDDLGMKYEIDDHDSMEVFQQNIVDFRVWMAERGYRDSPLVVTEYGILMPPDYGFPPERVADFLTGSFDYFLSARDETIGYAADDNRLVQRWFWFVFVGIHNEEWTATYLYDVETGQLTPLGERYVEYVYENAPGQ